MRPLPTGLATALASGKVPGVFLVALDWPNSPVYAWNGYAPLVWNSITWQGTGHLGAISEVTESADMTANGMVLSLSGIPLSEVAQALRNDTQGRRAQVFFGVLNTNGFAIDPVCIFDGVIDQPSIQENADDQGNVTATISITLEKEFIDNRSSARRYTHEDQMFLFAGDLGCEYTSSIAAATFPWGKELLTGGGTPPGGGSLPPGGSGGGADFPGQPPGTGGGNNQYPN